MQVGQLSSLTTGGKRFGRSPKILCSLDVRGLLPFRALRDFKLNFLSFFQSLKASHLDCGKVREKIFAAIVRGDKPITF